MILSYNIDAYNLIVKYRNERKLIKKECNELIRDLRIYFNYDIPKNLYYLCRYAEIVLQILRKKNFLCPKYHHLYISVAETAEEAICRCSILDDWNTHGIAVLKKETFLNADIQTQEELILKIISDGLHDIAEMDGLDKEKIVESISEARSFGLMSEMIFKRKENNKLRFTISLVAIRDDFDEEIYLTIEDKINERKVKWKFGKENRYTLGLWFGTIQVTNKYIRTKNRAHSDLALKGKTLKMEFDVEKEFRERMNLI